MTKPNDTMLLKANLKQLRLPTITAEFEKLAKLLNHANPKPVFMQLPCVKGPDRAVEHIAQLRYL